MDGLKLGYEEASFVLLLFVEGDMMYDALLEGLELGYDETLLALFATAGS